MCVRLRNFTAFIIIMIVASCSTQRNTLITRTYHQVTAKYNTYFNGRESFRTGVRRAEQQFRYDYNKILPVFLYTDPDIARSVGPQMDRAIDKASKVIANKSITARPSESGGLFGGRDEQFYKQNEYNKWVRESYLLAGKAHFHKHDFAPAIQAFLFIIRMYGIHDIRHEAKIWLARTYTESGRYNEARLTFEEMQNDPEFPDDLDAELFSSIAHFHLKQNRLSDALINLERALEDAGDKDTRARYTYILAQLYERTGDYQRASEYYDRVVRLNPEYDMVFNARISRAGVYQTGSGETGTFIRDLERMLRDDKNRDFQDQIYYALGNIYLRNGDEENAIRNYSLSAGAPGENPSQKTVTYLALADIYFSRPDYMTAQAYYDSAVINMGQGFPDRIEISEKRDMLTGLVTNIRQYELEDSVQVLAAMTQAERNRVIDNIIAMVREDEAEARRQEQLAQQTPQYRTARSAQAARQQAQRTGDGNWYFYNPSAVTFGENEFESLWGDRRLEDNWRRSNRQVVIQDEFAMIDDFDSDTEEEDDVVTDIGSREYYMRNIPLTEQAMEASHERLQEALYSMGTIFRDDLQDYRRSAEAFEELVRRYPEGDLALPSLYELHRVNLMDNNNSAAERFKDLIVSGYPESYYAAVLTNPNFFREYEEQVQAAGRYYEETFEMFRSDRYEQVIERAMYASATWPDSPLIPRFEYLQTLSYGSRGNMPLFRDMLEEYTQKYPDTEMAQNAREFIAYLDDDYPEIIHYAEVPVVQDIYSGGHEGDHYFVLIADNRQELINRMVFNIVNFNVDNFARLNLNVSSHNFSTNYQLLRVEGLNSFSEALDYLRRFSASEEVFSEVARSDFPVFIISPGNYQIFLKDRNIASYRSFFEEEYLNGQNP